MLALGTGEATFSGFWFSVTVFFLPSMPAMSRGGLVPLAAAIELRQLVPRPLDPPVLPRMVGPRGLRPPGSIEQTLETRR